MSTWGASNFCAGVVMEDEQRPHKVEALLQGSWAVGRQETFIAKLLSVRPWGWKLATVMYLHGIQEAKCRPDTFTRHG